MVGGPLEQKQTTTYNNYTEQLAVSERVSALLSGGAVGAKVLAP